MRKETNIEIIVARQLRLGMGSRSSAVRGDEVCCSVLVVAKASAKIN
jgi:hypothetical protein